MAVISPDKADWVVGWKSKVALIWTFNAVLILFYICLPFLYLLGKLVSNILAGNCVKRETPITLHALQGWCYLHPCLAKGRGRNVDLIFKPIVVATVPLYFNVCSPILNGLKNFRCDTRNLIWLRRGRWRRRNIRGERGFIEGVKKWSGEGFFRGPFSNGDPRVCANLLCNKVARITRIDLHFYGVSDGDHHAHGHYSSLQPLHLLNLCCRQSPRGRSLLIQLLNSVGNSGVYMGGAPGKAISSVFGPIGSLDDLIHLFSSCYRIFFGKSKLLDRDPSKNSRENNHQPIMESDVRRLSFYPGNTGKHWFISIVLQILGGICIFFGLGCFRFWLFNVAKRGKRDQILGSIRIGIFVLGRAVRLIHLEIDLAGYICCDVEKYETRS